MEWDVDLPDELVEQLWTDPRRLLGDGEVLQDKPRCVTVRLERTQGIFFFKYYNWGGPLRTLKKSLGPTRLAASWFVGLDLRTGGVPTPRPRAMLKRAWDLSKCIVIC